MFTPITTQPQNGDFYKNRKCGADFRSSNERLWNAQLKINDTRPHTWIVWVYAQIVHSHIAIQEMSAVVILLVVKFSRFLVKDKSENTFIKYVCHGHNVHDTTKLVKISQMTTLLQGLVRIK